MSCNLTVSIRVMPAGQCRLIGCVYDCLTMQKLLDLCWKAPKFSL